MLWNQAAWDQGMMNAINSRIWIKYAMIFEVCGLGIEKLLGCGGACFMKSDVKE